MTSMKIYNRDVFFFFFFLFFSYVFSYLFFSFLFFSFLRATALAYKLSFIKIFPESTNDTN